MLPLAVKEVRDEGAERGRKAVGGQGDLQHPVLWKVQTGAFMCVAGVWACIIAVDDCWCIAAAGLLAVQSGLRVPIRDPGRASANGRNVRHGPSHGNGF